MEEPMAKGICFRSFLKALGRLRGERPVAATVDLLQGELRTHIKNGLILSGNWYPLAWYSALHRAAQEATGEGVELARLIGKEATRDDLTGIYRIFLLVASPEFVISKAPLLFGTYYNTGAMQVSHIGKGRARAYWLGCRGFDRNIWSDVLGGSQAALEAAGAKDVLFTVISGGADGDESMEIEARWT